MTISNQVQQIIDRRKARLPMIEASIAEQHKLLDAMEALEAARREMLNEQGEIIPNNRFQALLDENLDLAGELELLDIQSAKDAAWNCINALEECRRRNARESVQVSVIGRARIGKSAVLQSFSGLDSRVIPSFDSTDCTGATSIIHNVPGSPVRATLTFKSREDMRALAQEYLDNIIPDESQRIRLRDMSDIAAIDMNEVSSRMPVGSSKGVFLKALGNMVKHYDEWAPYAGRRDSLVLTDQDEIITFVAQNNGHPVGNLFRREYFKYLTVNTCNIDCSFPEQDLGAVTLIDTIGIGDNQLNITEKMLKTVKEESDAAIFLMMPTDGAGGGLPDYIASIYESIYKVCSDRDMDKWLFYFLNHVPQSVNKVKKNSDECMVARESILSARWLGQEPMIVNARDTEACQDFLRTVLSKLLENLDDVDKLYFERAAKVLKDGQTAYGKLSSALGKMTTSCGAGKSNMHIILDLCEKTCEDIVRLLRGMVEDWKEVRDQPSALVFRHAEAILFDMQQGRLIPDAQEITDRLGGMQNWELMGEYMNQIRNEISRRFLDVDVVLQEQIDQMKEDVARKMCTQAHLERIYPMQEGMTYRQWMQEFTDFAIRAAGEYPGLTLALDTLKEFDFSVKNFLTYEVRSSLRLLDPNETVPPVLNLANRRQTALSIRSSLTQMTVDTAREVRESMRELCIKPNRAIYAEIADFADRLVYMQGMKQEWRSFLIANAQLMWADELRKNSKMSQLDKEWMDLINNILDAGKRGAFHIKEVK